jgi:hypothetical protein
MAQLSKEKTEKPTQESPVVATVAAAVETVAPAVETVAPAVETVAPTVAAAVATPSAAVTPEPSAANQDIDEILNSLKTLLSAVEKLQKVRQEVGDIKPLLMRMLDGELIAGEDLEQLKVGVGGLIRLVKAHSDHQVILTKAQAARSLLDQVLKTTSTAS